MSVKWVFDPAPPSGKRTGGNAAEYSFEGKVDTLVREVVQNSLDARQRSGAPVAVRFRVIDLMNSELSRFLSGMGWMSLQDNLLAVPEKRGGRSIRRAIDDMQEETKLRLLVIEDRGTRGLEGAEQRLSDDQPNSFCALVRDELYSDKRDEGAGGSFGLGKSVLWAYSAFKTVLFSSVPLEAPSGKGGLRLIGRTSLPYHSTDEDGPCTGDGWFGVPRDMESPRRRAESVWGVDANHTAEECYCGRLPDEPGLSTVIVGLAEPGEEDREAVEVVEAIVEAALESFWPAMVRGYLRIEVCHEENGEIVGLRQVDPVQAESYGPVVELLRGFDGGELQQRQSLELGESAVEMVEIELPEKLEDGAHPSCRGEVAVLVTLVSPEGYEAVRDRIFRFRRPGMIVRSDRGRNLSIGARPYAAVVVAGEACGDSESHERVEHFLRSAEPPAHDLWTHNTRSIKQLYRAHGAKAMLDRFDRAVLSAVRGLVTQPEEKGGALPKAVLRHLRFGDSGGGGNPRFLAVTHERAWPSEGSWEFKARCRRIRPDDSPWFVKVRLKYAVDGGGGDDVHAIDEVRAEGAIRVEVRNGVGWIEFSPEVSTAVVSGRAARSLLPTIGTRSAVQLRIDGEKGVIADA